MRKRNTYLRFLRCFGGSALTASKASVDTLAIFTKPKAPRKCLLESLPKPGTLGQNVPK